MIDSPPEQLDYKIKSKKTSAKYGMNFLFEIHSFLISF